MLTSDQVATMKGALQGERARLVEVQGWWAKESNTHYRLTLDIVAIDEVLTALDAMPVAPQWEPLPDGEYRNIDLGDSIKVWGEMLTIVMSTVNGPIVSYSALPPDIRLCRQRPAAEDAAP